jgi:type VI protein secretion system component VasK
MRGWIIVIYLIVAGFWLVIGVMFLGQDWFFPGTQRLVLPIANLSVGWLGIFLAGYNLIRWRMQRAYLQRQREQQAEERQRRRKPRREFTGERDPNFIFDAPPRPDEPRQPGGNEAV